jgi:hypothetical protein
MKKNPTAGYKLFFCWPAEPASTAKTVGFAQKNRQNTDF